MLKIYQLVIDATETAGEHFRYLGVKTAYVYRNGQPTTEIKDYRVTLALVERGYNTLDVTIPQPPGDIPIDSPVKIEGLTIKAYVIDGKSRITATSSSIELVEG